MRSGSIDCMSSRILMFGVLMVRTVHGQAAGNAAPKFEDYPAQVMPAAKRVAPKLTTPAQRRFRTTILDSVAKGPNFAGHFTIAEWGCGSGCLQFVVVDLETGEVHESPFGSLPKAVFCAGESAEGETGLLYHADSSLLIARGCPNFKNCGAVYYQWSGGKFKLLRETAAKIGGCN